jgi:hypothetical protein
MKLGRVRMEEDFLVENALSRGGKSFRTSSPSRGFKFEFLARVETQNVPSRMLLWVV